MLCSQSKDEKTYLDVKTDAKVEFACFGNAQDNKKLLEAKKMLKALGLYKSILPARYA